MKKKFKTFLIVSGAAVFIALVWSFGIEPSQLVIRKETISIEGWPSELHGLKIAVLSDLHVGAPHIDLEKLRKVVKKTVDLRPDLIVLLGDYVIHGVVGGTFIEPEQVAFAFESLNAPLGVYAVLGNHDWWYDGNRVRRALEEVGIPVLENTSAKVKRGQDVIWLAGLADAWTRTPDIAKALQNIPSGQPIIALTHNPDVFPEIPSRVPLTLAGHTHGGQVCLPLVGRPIVPSKFGQRYAYGHRQEGSKHLFVTSGIGTSIIPVRFRVPPEIVVLELHAENLP